MKNWNRNHVLDNCNFACILYSRLDKLAAFNYYLYDPINIIQCKLDLCKIALYQKYLEKILNVRTEFETRFAGVKSLKTSFVFIFLTNLESVVDNMKMDISIQCDSDLKEKYYAVSLLEFYMYLPDRFVNIRNSDLKLYLYIWKYLAKRVIIYTYERK